MEQTNLMCQLSSPLLVFAFDYQTFNSVFKKDSMSFGCFNHDIVVGLCSEIFMRFSYYIYPGYDKKVYALTWGSNPGPQSSTLPMDQSANSASF